MKGSFFKIVGRRSKVPRHMAADFWIPRLGIPPYEAALHENASR